MKKKISWIGIAVITIGVLAVVMLTQKRSVDQGGEQASKKVPKTEFKEPSPKKSEAATDDKAEQADKVTQESKNEEQMSPKLQKMAKLAKMQLADVKFFGRVVDQRNTPVEGVIIRYSVTPATFGYGGGSGETTTDGDGDFEVSGIEGTGVTIREMTKSGYQIALSGQGKTFFNRSEVESRLRWEDCTQETPCLFKAWKYGEGYVEDQKFIKKWFSSAMQMNGKEYSLYFFHYGWEKYSDDLSRGELLISFHRESGDGSPWQFSIKSRAGGLVEAKGLYTNEAPERGYQDVYTTTEGDVEGGAKILKKKFYFYLKDKNNYGCLDLELRLQSKSEKTVISGYYTINPSGSRFLETFDGIKKFEL